MKIKILVECPELAELLAAVEKNFPNKVILERKFPIGEKEEKKVLNKTFEISESSSLYEYLLPVNESSEDDLAKGLTYYLECFANQLLTGIEDEDISDDILDASVKEFFEGIVENFPSAVAIELRPGSLTDVIVVSES